MPVPDFSGINSSRHLVFKFLLEFTPDLFRGTGMTENCSCRDGVPPPSKWKIGQ
jgi:hypothetical protein